MHAGWGTGWGEQGYARVKMTGDSYGPCQMYYYVGDDGLYMFVVALEAEFNIIMFICKCVVVGESW